MSWYKIAQRQQLLFYPWDKGIGDAVQKAEPIGVNSEGENIYKCHMCQQNVTDDEISEWAELDDSQKKYQYPIHNIDSDTIKQQLQQILDTVKPHVEKYKSDVAAYEVRKQEILKSPEFSAGNVQYPYWTKSHYVTKIPELQSIISDPSFKQYAELQTLRSWNWTLSNFFRALYGKSINGDQLEMFAAFIDNPNGLLSADLEDQSNFSVQVSVPVCDECINDVAECQICDKHIFEGQPSYPVCWDNNLVVCQECVENGDVSTCPDCGCADTPDDMHYIEDEGDYCDSCFSDHVRDYAGYFSDIVERKAENNPYPFTHWFENGDRTYLPFTPDLTPQESDNELMDFIEYIEIDGNSCSTNKAEYQLGYSTCGRRKFRIGKLLGRWYKNEIKRIDEETTGSEGEMEKTETKQKYNYYKEILDGSKFRSMKDTSNLTVVISQDPHDMAKMSTGRRWTSCMDLQKDRSQDVFCEVEEGGLIAYLIDSSDKDVENPHARILIRRFSNKKGDSVAIPEDAVYGNNLNGFEEVVSDWINSKQNNIVPGDYDRKGMGYSESLSRTRTFAEMLRELLIKMASKDIGYKMIKSGNK